jgi:small GTP-binding protein
VVGFELTAKNIVQFIRMSETSNTLKYIIAGNSGVGKTSIVSCLTNDVFRTEVQPTIGIDFVIAKLHIHENPITLQIWDTAGQERFQSLTKSYFRVAMAVILVFDLTDRRSFDDVNKWLTDVHNLCQPNVMITLVGNKLDKEDGRVVSRTEATSFADLHQISYFETSAQRKENISEAFKHSATTLLDRSRKRNDIPISIDSFATPRSVISCPC